MTSHALILEFFPDARPEHGPFGLLGLPLAEVDEAAVDEALNQRLEALSERADSNPADAAVVRMALHVARAQLLRPALRAEQLAFYRDQSRPVFDTQSDSSGPPRPRRPLSPTDASQLDPPPALLAPDPTLAGRPARPSAPTQYASQFPSNTPIAATSHAAVRHDPLADTARQLIAASGGWNPTAKRRLMSLALAQEVPLQRLIQAAVSSPAPGPTQPTPQVGAPARPSIGESATARQEVSARLRFYTLLLTIGSGCAFAALLWVLWIRLDLGAGFNSSNDALRASAEHAISERVGAATPFVVDDPELAPPPDIKALYADLRALDAETIRDDSYTASASITTILDRLSRSWPEIDPQALRSIPIQIRDALNACAAHKPALVSDWSALVVNDTTRLADAMSMSLIGDNASYPRTPIELRQAVWSVGLTIALRGEQVPSPTERQVRIASNRVTTAALPQLSVENDLLAGLTLGLRRVGQALLLDPDQASIAPTWSAWTRLTRKLNDHHDPARVPKTVRPGDSAALGLIGDAMKSPTDTDVSQVLAAAIDAVAWPGNEYAIDRLMSWIAEPEYSPERVSRILAMLIDTAALPGLSSTDRLAFDADMAQRLQLRDALAARLGTAQLNPRSGVANRWQEATADLLAVQDPTSLEGAIDLALRLTLVAEAAAHIMTGEQSEVNDAIRSALSSQLLPGVKSPLPRGSDPTRPSNSTSNPFIDFNNPQAPSRPVDRGPSWAARFIAAARDNDQRAELLNQMRSGDAVLTTYADADLIASSACFGTPTSIRRRAQEVVLVLADNAMLMDAMIGNITRAAHADDVSDLVTGVTSVPLPHHDDPGWEDACLEALLLHRLSLEAAVSLPWAQDAQIAIEASNLRSAQAIAQTHGLTPPVDPDPIWGAWYQHASRFPLVGGDLPSLTEIERQRDGLLLLGEPGLPAEVLRATSRNTLLGYALAAERPSRAPAIATILAQREIDNRAAPTVAHQLLLCARTRLLLWQLRLDPGSHGDSTQATDEGMQP